VSSGCTQVVPKIAALEPEFEGLYRDLHEHPELAFHEQRAAAILAEMTRSAVLGTNPENPTNSMLPVDREEL
jgi:metal-dependent amidase/aminoacylase/carboxypeptidase family protein